MNIMYKMCIRDRFITAVYGICESSVMEKGVAAIAVILISVLLFDNYSIEEKICAS